MAAAESQSDEEIDEDDLNNEASQQLEMKQIVQAVEVDVQEETELVPEDETINYKDEGKQEKKIDTETDKYYAVYYSPTFHIGKVIEVVDQDLL